MRIVVQEKMKQDWAKLNRLQIGAYAEYYVKMAFTRFGFQVYTSEVDDRGIDFVCRFDRGPFYEVQVKSIRKTGYIFAQKDKFELRSELLLAVVIFTADDSPDLFLIPSMKWLQPNALLVDRNYEGKKSKPEWGINLSRKNQHLLEPFAFEQQIQIMKSAQQTPGPYPYEVTDYLHGNGQE